MKEISSFINKGDKLPPPKKKRNYFLLKAARNWRSVRASRDFVHLGTDACTNTPNSKFPIHLERADRALRPPSPCFTERVDACQYFLQFDGARRIPRLFLPLHSTLQARGRLPNILTIPAPPPLDRARLVAAPQQGVRTHRGQLYLRPALFREREGSSLVCSRPCAAARQHLLKNETMTPPSEHPRTCQRGRRRCRRQRLRGFRCTLRRLPLFQVKEDSYASLLYPLAVPYYGSRIRFEGDSKPMACSVVDVHLRAPASFEGLRARGFLRRQRLHSAIVTFSGKEMLFMFLFAFRRSWLTANYTFIFLIALQTHVTMRSTSTAANPHTFLIFLGYCKP